MTLVNHSVTNLINGVSEQDPTVRLDNQVEEQINAYSDITRGLTRRNGLELMNVAPKYIRDYTKISFNIDGVSHCIALNADHPVNQAIYIPLRTDDPDVTISLQAGSYFKGALPEDISILEDKERVYILNKKKQVGTASGRTTYFDIATVNDRTNIQDDNWERGSYYLRFTASRDPNFSVVTEETMDILVDKDTTVSDIVSTYNANTALVDQTGEIVGEGSKERFRISFREIPSGWVLPTCITVDNVDLEWDWTEEVDSGWIGTFSGSDYYVSARNSFSRRQSWVYNNSTIANRNSTSDVLVIGDTKYYKGALWTRGSNYYYYKIKRVQTVYNTDTYTPVVTTPNQTSTSTQGATDGMVWITGVSQDQTYDITLNYYDVTAPNTPLTVTATASVGSTASNIKLNWVADTLSTDLNTDTNLVSTTYDNAIYILMNSGYEISSIDVTNNFDTSSITGVPRATEGNTAGLTEISSLPPSFIQGFTVRVNASQGEVASNYYMTYDAGFKGWKEKPLDETRFLDQLTMPYVIDKQDFRETGVITIKPIFWDFSEAGDEESNEDPSFVDRTINDMFFYGNRLGFATDDTLVLSAIDQPLQFFRTTTALVKQSDRKDIKLDSSKIGYNTIKHVVSYEGRLLVNTGYSQSVLLVNSSFDLTSARLSEVSSYTLGDTRPLPVGNSLYFALSSLGTTRIHNYSPLGNNVYENIDMTKHCPQYIKGEVLDMGYDSGLALVRTDDDAKTLYVQNTYHTGGQVIQNAWHKWTLPYDVEHFYFFNNELIILMSANDIFTNTYTMVAKYNLSPQDIEEVSDEVNIGWTPYMDLYTEDFFPIRNFSEFQAVNLRSGFHYDTKEEGDEATEQLQVLETNLEEPTFNNSGTNDYYWQVVNSQVNIVWNDSVTIAGGGEMSEDHTEGSYKYYRGEDQGNGYYSVYRYELVETTEQAEQVLFGIPFETSIELSKVVPRVPSNDGGYTVMNFSKLMLRRMRLLLGKSGIFEVTVNLENRSDVVKKFTGKPVGSFVVGRGTVSDINFRFPINTFAQLSRITIRTLDTTPMNLLATEWQGQMITRGRNI